MVRLSLLAFVLLTATSVAQTYDFKGAARYSEQRGGHALLVMIDGKIVFESYANGWDATKPHYLASGTKSFTGVMVMMAVEDGLLTLNEKVSDTVTEWRSDPLRSQITYRQLLSLISGLDGGTNGQAPSYADAIKTQATAAPNTKFQYGPNPFQSFGEALKRKLAAKKETVAQYYKRRLIDPLGMSVPIWRNFSTGEPSLPSGAYLIAREWAKFGEMVRRGGLVGSKRLIRKNLLSQCFRGSKVKPLYGLCWWITTLNGSALRAVVARGAGTQRLYVIGKHRMVIVRFGHASNTWTENGFFEALMPAAFQTFGAGCRGSVGAPSLTAAAGSLPRLGTNLDLRVTKLPASAAGALYLGTSDKVFNSIPLPWDLTPYGMPGCSALVSLNIALPFQAKAGVATPSLPIPSNRSLITYSIYLQALSIDPSANALGVTVSNGAGARIGVR